VRTRDDEDLCDPSGTHALEHLLDQELLLRAAEPRRRTGGEHDGADHLLEIVIERTTTIRVGLPAGSFTSPYLEIVNATGSPLTTRPSTA